MPLHSARSTPTKTRPPPLYYDYSEDFSPNNYAHPEIVDPPPQFHIERAIPEDRQVSADCLETEDRTDSAKKTRV